MLYAKHAPSENAAIDQNQFSKNSTRPLTRSGGGGAAAATHTWLRAPGTGAMAERKKKHPLFSVLFQPTKEVRNHP